MGFFNKLKNWISGKGWKEEEADEPVIQEPVETEMEKAERLTPTRGEIEVTDEGESKPVEEEKERTETKEIKPREESKELNKAVKQYEKAPKKTEIEKGINPEIENRVNVSQNQMGDMSGLRPQYRKIFTENAKLNDPDILEVLFRGRQQLQHRFTAQISVMIDGKYANTLEVVGILIEHTGMTYNYMGIGMQIDSPPQLDNLLLELGQAFESNFGAINSNIKSKNAHKGKITSIDIDVTFA